jgi:hypothetical protein
MADYSSYKWKVDDTDYIQTHNSHVDATEGTATEVEQARGGETDLDTRLDGQRTDIDAVTSEVVAARGSDPDLDTRITGIRTDVDAVQEGQFFRATSSTSITIGPGTHTLSLNEADRAFGVGSRVRIADQANPGDRYMIGVVTAYSDPDLTVDVGTTAGDGASVSDWAITLASVAPDLTALDPGTAAADEAVVVSADGKTLTSRPIIAPGRAVAIADGGSATVAARDVVYLGTNATATLPAGPSQGDAVDIWPTGDWAGTPSTVGRNGEPIHGQAEDLALDRTQGIRLLYIDATRGWEVR